MTALPSRAVIHTLGFGPIVFFWKQDSIVAISNKSQFAQL